MKSKIFEVKIYQSSFCTHKIEARTEDEAIEKARKVPINVSEILNNFECWKDADEVVEIGKYEKNRK
jgi:hypothetical protein